MRIRTAGILLVACFLSGCLVTPQLKSRNQLAATIIPEVAFNDARMSTVSAFIMDAAGFEVVEIEKDDNQLITLNAKNISALNVIESLRLKTGLLCEIDDAGAVYFNGTVVARPQVVSVRIAPEAPTSVTKAPARNDKKVSMRLMPFYEDDQSKSLRYIIVLDGVGFHSVTGFKNYLKRTKQGYTLNWDPGCTRDAGMPFSDKQSLDDFKAFCSTNKIELIITPSG